MPSGSCLCGKATVSYSGDPATTALCHCADCKKISGSSFSVNYIVPDTDFKSAGTKTYTKTADSGRPITSFFCPDCGSTLFRESPKFGSSKIIKVGVLDDKDAIAKAKPAVELYAPQRATWLPAIAGSAENPGMP